MLKKLKKFFGDISGYNAYVENALKEQLEEKRQAKLIKLAERKHLKRITDAIMKYAPTEDERLREEFENSNGLFGGKARN